MKFISIILITHNSKNKINEWCESLFNSLSPKIAASIEVIHVDSYPGDGTREIVKKYCNSLDINYKLIIQHPKGVYRALELGKINACGEWLVTINSDDRIHGHCLKEIINFLKQRIKESTSVVFFPIFYESYGIKIGSPQNLKNIFDLDKFGSAHSVGMFIRNKIWKELGSLYSSHKYCADYDLYMRLLKKNYPIKYANDFKPIGTFHVGGHTSTYKSQIAIFLEKISILYKYAGIKAVSRNIIYYFSKFINLLNPNNNKNRFAIFLSNKNISQKFKNNTIFQSIYKYFKYQDIFITKIETSNRFSLLNSLTNFIKLIRSNYIILYSLPNIKLLILAIFLKSFMQKKVFISENWIFYKGFNYYVEFIDRINFKSKIRSINLSNEFANKIDIYSLLNDLKCPKKENEVKNKNIILKNIPKIIAFK